MPDSAYTTIKNKILAVYMDGSFIRREMDNKSDLDILIIVKKSKDLDL